MKKYKVEITEILSKIVGVFADNEDEAAHKVSERYWDEKYVLDSSNYVDTEFSIVEGKMEK